MTDAVRLAFQNECRANLGRAAIAGQQTGIVGQTRSQYFALVPRAGSSKVLGAYVKFDVNYTASGAQNAVANQTVGPTTTPTDVLDGAFNEIQIAPAPNTNPRSIISTRLAAEELERITLDVRGYSYPRSVPANFAGAGSRTDTAFLFVAIGGGGGAIRFQIPAVTAVYAANVTATVNVTVYVVSGDNDTVVTINEKQTPSLGLGRNDGGQWFPTDMSPDFLLMLNETTTTITTLYITAADGTILADFQDAGVIGQAQSAVVAPDTTFTYNDLVFSLDRKRFLTFLFNVGATAGVRDLVFIEYAGGTSTNPPAAAAAVPASVPASSMTGTPAGSGAYVAPTGSVGVPISNAGGYGPTIAGGAFGGSLPQPVLGGTPFVRRAR